MPEHAAKAYSELDGKSFNGRLLHLLPGKSKETIEDLLEQGMKGGKKFVYSHKYRQIIRCRWSEFQEEETVANKSVGRLVPQLEHTFLGT